MDNNFKYQTVFVTTGRVAGFVGEEYYPIDLQTIIDQARQLRHWLREVF